MEIFQDSKDDDNNNNNNNNNNDNDNNLSFHTIVFKAG